MRVICSSGAARAAARVLSAVPSPVRPATAARRMSVSAAKQVISTDKAPAALGPYSQAIKVGSTVSGTVWMGPCWVVRWRQPTPGACVGTRRGQASRAPGLHKAAVVHENAELLLYSPRRGTDARSCRVHARRDACAGLRVWADWPGARHQELCQRGRGGADGAGACRLLLLRWLLAAGGGEHPTRVLLLLSRACGAGAQELGRHLGGGGRELRQRGQDDHPAGRHGRLCQGTRRPSQRSLSSEWLARSHKPPAPRGRDVEEMCALLLLLLLLLPPPPLPGRCR